MVSDLKTFAHKGCRIAAQKKVSFSANFALLAGFFGIGATIRIGREIQCLPYAGFFYQWFDFGLIWSLANMVAILHLVHLLLFSLPVVNP